VNKLESSHSGFRKTALVLAAAAVAGVVFVRASRANDPTATQRQPTRVYDLQSAVDQTASVIEGTVTAITPEYSDNLGPWTAVTLSNVTAHFGSAPSEVTIRQFGGPLPNGKTLLVIDQTRFVMGKRYVVFMRNTRWNLSPVVSRYALRVEAIGGREVLVGEHGRLATALDSTGVALSEPAFDEPDLNGGNPTLLPGSASASSGPSLDRGAFIDALRSHLAAHGLSVRGTHVEHPAGDFDWRAVPTSKAGQP
jgi:hypothetical protein